MPKKHLGRCACGVVTFEFDTDPDFVAICHCLDCKKASGGEAATWFAVPESDFSLLTGNPEGFHYTADSGGGLDRMACPQCHARLYTANLDNFPATVFVQLGGLDDATFITPKLEMFIKRRAVWAAPLDMPQFTDMPH